MSIRSPRAPLARSTLVHMGVRIGTIVALTTLLSYLHMFHTRREEALARLAAHASEYSQREQGLFLLAEDNHAVLHKALEERLRALTPEDVSTRFDHLFGPRPDGTVRSRAELLDGTRVPGVFVPRGVKVDEDLRRRILAAYDVLAQYGPAFHTRFTDTYVMLPEGPLILYWPEHPNFSQTARPDFFATSSHIFRISRPETNPARKAVWTQAYFDRSSQLPMVSVSTPMYLGDRHVATISHDVLLAEMLARIHQDNGPGAYNVLFRDDGQLITHPELTPKETNGNYNIVDPTKPPEGKPSLPGTEEQRAHLRGIFERVRDRAEGEFVLELPEYREYLAVGRILGSGWNFVSVLPSQRVTAPAIQATRYVLLLGIASLLLELFMMRWVLNQKIAEPLEAFTRASHAVASGDFLVELDTTRQDELGQLARSFRLMADKVHQREEELRHANEKLEQRVEERTRELKDVHAQLVQTARRAGMAEIATNVLHNVGNVLNSVYTSAQLARERLVKMRLEQVGRLGDMMLAHQSDIGGFLTEDERGRNVMPFLSMLGQHLVDARKDLLSLLEDVGRYTEHVGDIVKLQQSHARTPRLHEPVQLAELVEDALRINASGLTRHQVKVARDLTPLPPVLTDKHKTLMILVNLISNAQYALGGVPPDERLLTVRLEHTADHRIRIVLRDNGMGIAPEMLTRIFQFGFTTREEGHGFGLHSSALAAQELGGSLTAHSDGPGRGATFMLELPSVPAREVA